METKCQTRRMRSVLLFTLVIFISALGTACWRSVNQERIVGGPELRLRITSWPVFFMQSGYTIESSANDGWFRNVHSWTQDDPWKLSMIEAKVISDCVAYYFNVVDYGVTVDGGRTWQSFNYYSARQSAFGQFRTGGWPRVEIRADGSGEIYEQNFDNLEGPKYVTFFTSNFGQTWSVALRSPPMWGEFQHKR